MVVRVTYSLFDDRSMISCRKRNPSVSHGYECLDFFDAAVDE